MNCTWLMQASQTCKKEQIDGLPNWAQDSMGNMQEQLWGKIND